MPARLDQHDLRIEQVVVDCGAHGAQQRVGRHATVRQQHLDEGLGPGDVAEGPPSGVPISLMGRGEYPCRLGLGQRSRPGQGTRFDLEHLQVVIEDEHLGVLGDGPLVPGHHLRSVEHLDGRRAQAGEQPAADIARRYRVEPLPHADPRLGIDPWPQQPRGIEHLCGQRLQGRCFGGERRGHGDGAAGDHPRVVNSVGGSDALV